MHEAAYRPATLISVAWWAVPATMAIAGASVLISFIGALTRGPWIDEFWTLFAVDHSLSLTAALEQRWWTDVHPPLFYFLSRLMSDVAGENIAILRLQNSLAMLALIGFFLFANAVWRGSRRFLLVCAVLTFSSYFATGYFAELRSYYWQFVCGICFYCSGYFLLRREVSESLLARRAAMIIFAVSTLLLVNLHFVTTLLTGISIAGLALVAVRSGHYRKAIFICVCGLLALIPLILDLAFQGQYLIGRTGGQFWIASGFADAAEIAVGSLAKGIGLSLFAALLAAQTLGQSLLVGTSGEDAKDEVVIGAVFLALAIVPIGVLLVINIYTPVIVDRYLVLCSAAAICGMSVLVQDRAFSSPYGFALIVANAALFLGIAGHKLIEEPRWNASAALIAAKVATCPTTVIEAFPFPYPGALPNEGAVFALGYGYLAERHGFQFVMAKPGAPLMRDESAKCPTVLWSEHIPPSLSAQGDAQVLLLNTVRRVLGPVDLDDPVVTWTKTGAIIVLRPDSKAKS